LVVVNVKLVKVAFCSVNVSICGKCCQILDGTLAIIGNFTTFTSFVNHVRLKPSKRVLGILIPAFLQLHISQECSYIHISQESQKAVQAINEEFRHSCGRCESKDNICSSVLSNSVSH